MKSPRNEPCKCGSGKKYKKCHLLIERKEAEGAHERWLEGMRQRALDAEKRRKEFMEKVPTLSAPFRRGMAMPFMLAAMAASAFTGTEKK